MEIRHLKTFKAVADHLSFHKAANAIHYAQSTVSAQIMALESELEVHLFERLGRRIILTSEGENFYQYACKIIELAESARTSLSAGENPAGSLTIRVPESFCVNRLTPVVTLFRKRMPNVKLSFITCAVEGLVDDLKNGVTDLAFLLAESIQSKDLDVENLGSENLVLVAGPSHPLTKIDKVELEMLTEYTLLLSRVDCSYRRILEQMLQESQCEPQMVLEYNSVAAIIAGVSAGLGVTLVPEIAVRRELAKKKLMILPWPGNDMEVAQLMIWHKSKWISPIINMFMDTTREVLTKI
ncbi:MAG: LysR family transcriptional regulator [Proteobacteria bacterium]|nr:LysR family transcriptional regulator [Pseudomonadota bacterium]MBU1583265.1 LysR family transcriptional regulator [Pseudomonadota bacterium]MBU2628570.1 LysR family transcriptional regulator [Pseudomonadota bacterium]